MNIYKGSDILKIENHTVICQNTTFYKMMDTASSKIVLELMSLIENKVTDQIWILCGAGNNGGDGLCIAKMLKRLSECEITVCIVDTFSSRSDLNKYHLKSILHHKKINIYSIDNECLIPEIHSNAIVIDALFGVGLNKPIKGRLVHLVEKINSSTSYILSVDMPSGMFSHQLNEESDAIIDADKIITFQYLKTSLLFPSNGALLEKTKVAEIGLDDSEFRHLSFGEMLTKSHPLLKLVRRETHSYKNKNGKAVIIGGSKGMNGAPILSSIAALKVGAGYSILQSCSDVIDTAKSYPDLLINETNSGPFVSTMVYDKNLTYGIGPGLSSQAESEKALLNFLSKCTQPVVIDADGLNIIAKQKLKPQIPADSILTPHIGEFKRLIGSGWESEKDMFEKLKEYSIANQCITVLKGPHTCICGSDGKLHFNSTGNPALAVAGSGDVLTGMITGFLAQGMPPLESAIKGVYFHGLAADYFVKENNERSLTPTTLLNYIDKALNKI